MSDHHGGPDAAGGHGAGTRRRRDAPWAPLPSCPHVGGWADRTGRIAGRVGFGRSAGTSPGRDTSARHVGLTGAFVSLPGLAPADASGVRSARRLDVSAPSASSVVKRCSGHGVSPARDDFRRVRVQTPVSDDRCRPHSCREHEGTKDSRRRITTVAKATVKTEGRSHSLSFPQTLCDLVPLWQIKKRVFQHPARDKKTSYRGLWWLCVTS